jgi:hypothetical protein
VRNCLTTSQTSPNKCMLRLSGASDGRSPVIWHCPD